jgi:hypothetical protein
VDKELLFKARLPEADVELPIGTVRVRGLSRAEAIEVGAIDGIAAKERLMLALGMVEPTLTEEEAGRWQAAAAFDEIDPVSNKIAELSGMTPGAGKAAYADYRDDTGS